jgi:Carboxypeptidase regulatory-like domain
MPKMRTTRILFILLATIFLFSCSPVTRSNGEVIDQSGKPLDNAIVKITGKSVAANTALEQTTKADGRYDFGDFAVSGEKPIEIKLSVTKSGYTTFTKELKFGEDNVDKIILELEKK